MQLQKEKKSNEEKSIKLRQKAREIAALKKRKTREYTNVSELSFYYNLNCKN